jgi:muramidase (phage lysozyme)
MQRILTIVILSVFVVIVATSTFIAPKVAVANEETTDGVVQGRSLVQCGGTGQPECTLCHVFMLFRDIFNFALQILASLAVLSVFIGGVYMLVSGANPSMFAQGVQIIQYAIIGIIITGASFIIMNTILVILGFQSTSVAGALTVRDGLFSVECDTANYFQDRGPEEREIGDNTPQRGGGGSGSANVGTGSLNVACLADDSLSDEISAVMRAITYYEGVSDAAGYYRLVGGRMYPETQLVHPRIIGCCNSTAYGRFQMIDDTWAAWAAAAGVPKNVPRSDGANTRTGSAPNPDYDMSPVYQDRAVAQALRGYGMVDCSSFRNSANRCQWASIEGCSQPNDKTRANSFLDVCNTMLEDEKNGTC